MKKLYGKILIIILPIIGAFFMLKPTWDASQLQTIWEQKLKDAQNAPSPADSLEIIEQFEKEYGDAFLSAKQSRIKLGLDLRGGMYVTLEVDVIKMLEESANKNAIDEIFTSALERTRADLKESNKDAVETFVQNLYDAGKTAGKEVKLTDYFDAGGRTDDEEKMEKAVVNMLKDIETESMDQAMLVFKQRFDAFGVAEINILKQGSRRIMVEVPGVSNEKDIMSLLQTTARLEFKLVKNEPPVLVAFHNIDNFLAKQAKALKLAGVTDATSRSADSAMASNDTTKAEVDSAIAKAQADSAKVADSAAAADTSADAYAGLTDEEKSKRYIEDHPFTTLFETFYWDGQKNSRNQQVGYMNTSFGEGVYNFHIYEPTIKKFREILARPEIKEMLPEGIEIMLSKPEKVTGKDGKEYRSWAFYALKKEAELRGDVITSAVATYDQTQNQPIVSMTMNSEGAEKWARITGENIGKRIAIILDDQVYSAPNVINKIVGGSSQITGVSTEEAKLLKTILNAGKLKVPVEIVEKRVVGPSLGEDSIRSGITSIIVAAILVVLFMAIYYAVGGLIADFAVMLNILLIVAVLAAFKGTLTLPGIAGIILTLGMAVDANVLIYERIREELYKGRSLRSAIDEGYSKAMTAILDSNITTFIIGLILYFFGTGPILGFAMTLIIGILATLFCQIVVTRAIIEIIVRRGATYLNIGQPRIINQA